MQCTFHGEPLPQKIYPTSYRVSSPKVSFRTLDVPGATGLIRAGRKTGERRVTLRLALFGDGFEEDVSLLRSLTAWCRTDSPRPLTLPGYDGVYLLAECAVYPDPVISPNGTECAAEFVCHDPLWHASEVTAAEKGVPFTVGGTEPAPFTLSTSFAEPRADTTWLLDGEPFLTLKGELPAGEVTIDTEHGRVTVGDGSTPARMTPDSDADRRLSPGTHVWQCSDEDAVGTLCFRELSL